MRIEDRFRKMLAEMPPGSSVTLPVETLREWLSDSEPDFEPDLTVAEVADLFGRSPVTVRGWVRSGELRAYRLRGREYRITRDALEEFQRRARRRGLALAS